MGTQLATVSVIEERLARYQQIAAGALSENTVKAIRSDTAIFARWCGQDGLASLPAVPDTLAAFIDASAADKAPATIRRHVASIAHIHRAAELPNPADSDVVRLALRRMARAKGTRQQQAPALNRPLIDRMIAAQPDTPAGLRNRALLAVMYDSMVRRSELVALDVADIETADDGSGTVTVNRSKSDQEGAGSVRFLAHDTMQHVTTWMTVASIETGPLFRSVRKAGAIGGRLADRDVARIVKRMAKAAGLDIDPSGHSCRVGASQDMVAAGFSLPEIMQAADWKSPAMPARYSAHLGARRGAAAKLAAIQNRD